MSNNVQDVIKNLDPATPVDEVIVDGEPEGVTHFITVNDDVAYFRKNNNQIELFELDEISSITMPT
ncbi:hypothetical protein [Salinibacillus xinjiangensis]|uniref:H-type small acid-soluble spore protein n=1 Tax=Salinibacillus xinjiangensis TaxID=1229268 RepID=A0A6G1X8V3_9BACI|nr:hypothetical protein [Salinibacillus xinjiangensis]MRG87372.1 hypothetical protein [Salinibacillus xinjiangensis]